MGLWEMVEYAEPEDRIIILEQPNGIALDDICVHTAAYIKYRDSFYKSRQWKDFRANYLSQYPSCVECGEAANTVHHTDDNTIDMTLLKHGYLSVLKWGKFESVWEVKTEFTENDWEILVKSGFVRVADCNGVDYKEAKANAHLIAAAPAMYEALKKVSESGVNLGQYLSVEVLAALKAAEGKE